MGKVKKTVMDDSQESKVKSAKASKKKSMTIWEDLYTDLSENVALALRSARVKPEQLQNMTDGDLTAIDGITDNGLEEIRAKYALDLSTPAETTTDATPAAEVKEEAAGPLPANKRHLFKNGKAILAAKSKVNPQSKYGIEEAVKLVKATNITKFDATVTLHLNLVAKDAPTRVELSFPHMAGAAKRVAIVTDDLLKDIEKGKIEFDILLTTPAFMPKLAKYAKVLGPKGLMPSPKAGTVAADPEKKAKEFAAGKTVVKAEAKFPLMHVTVGKVSQKEDELIANIKALVEAVKLKNITKATLASTMSPGVKLQLN
jgi:large subunit ribosomal protein L1